MALLVFLTFLSLIVNQYVPVWMKDSESAHMNTALGQFSQFKSSVDLQMLAVRSAQEQRRQHVPVTAFAPVTLGIDGVPIFTSPTPGTLETLPNEAPWNVWFRKTLAGTTYEVNESSSGVVRLSVSNRYFVAQDIIYENGAVIRAQRDGQFVRVEPPILADLDNQTVSLGYVLFSLFGTSSLSGTTTEGVNHKVVGDNLFVHTNVTSDAYINGTSRYGVAWYDFLNVTLASSYAISAEAYKGGTCSSGTYRFCRSLSGAQLNFIWVDNPYYHVEATWNSATRLYRIRVTIQNDATDTDAVVPRITLFSLEHGFINVAAGSVNTGSI